MTNHLIHKPTMTNALVRKPTTIFDLREKTRQDTSHPLRDNNVVVVDPDTGDVFDPREGYTANQLPNTDLMAVPRTTWYVPYHA